MPKMRWDDPEDGEPKRTGCKGRRRFGLRKSREQPPDQVSCPAVAPAARAHRAPHVAQAVGAVGDQGSAGGSASSFPSDLTTRAAVRAMGRSPSRRT